MNQFRSIKLFDLLEGSFVVLVLFLMGEAVLKLAITGGNPESPWEGDTYYVLRITTNTVYLITFVLALTRWREIVRLCWRNKLLVGLLLLAGLSALWSLDPAITLRRAYGLASTTLFAMYLVTRFRPEQFVRLLAITLCLAAVASLAMIVVKPAWGIHHGPPHDGSWRGVFAHKNILGQYMGLGLLVCFLLARHENRGRLVHWSGVALCGILVAMSGSRAAWITLVFLLAAYPMLHMLRTHLSILIPVLMVSMVLAITTIMVMVEYSPAIFKLLGRDSTLSGRTFLWTMVVNRGLEQPWLGHGFQAFWQTDSEPALDIWESAGWTPLSSHNGFLDIWLDLGVVGLVLFLAQLAVTIGATVGLLRRHRGLVSYWYGMVLLYLLGLSTAQLGFLQPFKLTWVVYVTTACYAAAATLTDEPADTDPPATSDEPALAAKAEP